MLLTQDIKVLNPPAHPRIHSDSHTIDHKRRTNGWKEEAVVPTARKQ